MPLPETPISLIHATMHSKPKRAMMVRMSAETFDALEDNPQLLLDLGDAPGIHIGDAFFAMRPQKESSPHELYLRVSSAAKPLAPLKLYANVVGKFIVERQLEDKVEDKVRQQTIAAKQQHLERQAILLEQPPVLSTKNQKRKTPGSGTVIKKSSPLAAPQPSKANADLRRRLIHFLAMNPRFTEDVVKMVGGANISSSAREDLLALLDQVGEQQPPVKKGDKSPAQWVLKPQSWTEVRPFEWPKLSEGSRVNMARQARMRFKDLGIPDSDPAWEHVRYRSTAPAIPAPPPVASSSSNRSSTGAQGDIKRSVTSTKETKQKSKQEPARAKGEIQMKDETKSSASRQNTTKRSEGEKSVGMKTVASRRLPGSGYQVKKSPQPSAAATEKAGSSIPPPASLPQKPPPAGPPPGGPYGRKTIPTMPPKAVKKDDESDREREIDRQREREKREREKEKEKEREERERERVEMERREKLKQREREKRQREKEREREREREEIEQGRQQREKERIAKEKPASGVTPFKRKTVGQDPEGSHDEAVAKVPKRRKLEDGTAAPSKPRDVEPKPSKPVHQPSPAPRPKMRKDPSPQAPTSQDRRATTSTSGPTHKSERSKMSGTVKRRRSPIYTSSEDEGEIPQPKKRNPSPLPASEQSISSDQPPSDRVSHRRTRGYPPASDHAALRSMYQSRYTTYLGTFSKVVAQRRKLEAMLNGDSEAELDVMDPEEIVKLSLQHKDLRDELECIHSAYIHGVLPTPD